MKETERIVQLFEDLYNGNPWIDVTIHATLEKISAGQAANKVSPNWNSIWQIVNHLISWRETVLQRLHGQLMPSPPNNYFDNVIDSSEDAWSATLKRLED